MFLPNFVALCATRNWLNKGTSHKKMDYDSLDTRGFHVSLKYAFVTHVART